MNLLSAYLIAWALTYISCAIIKPDYIQSVFGRRVSKENSGLSMFLIGTFMILGIILLWTTTQPLFTDAGRIILGSLGIFESFGCVASFTHTIEWKYNGRNPNDIYVNNMAQISMGILDLVAAAFLFILV